jgi:hypothetical protein
MSFETASLQEIFWEMGNFNVGIYRLLDGSKLTS